MSDYLVGKPSKVASPFSLDVKIKTNLTNSPATANTFSISSAMAAAQLFYSIARGLGELAEQAVSLTTSPRLLVWFPQF